MGSIAKRAEVNQSLIHYHFGSKEKLYTGVLERLIGVNQTEELITAVNEMDLSPSKKLYIAIYLLVCLSLDPNDQDLTRIIAHELADDRKNLIYLVRENILPHFVLFVELIKEGIEQGEFKTDYPGLTVINLLAIASHLGKIRDILDGTDYYDLVFEENFEEKLFNYLVQHTFKALSPDFDMKKIEISEDIKVKLDNIIDDIRKSQVWEIE